jgi:hypothetical protein
MIDPFYDWPFNETEMNIYIVDKYGAESINDIHHYESALDANTFALPVGEIVTDDYAYNKSSVSNSEYESILNENKRPIKLLKPEFLSDIKDERERILAEYYNRG